MKIVAAYLLASLGGNSKPSAVRDILTSAGIDVEEDMLDLFYKSIEGKDLNDLLQLGAQKFVSGGGGGGGGAVVASGGAGAAAAPAAEEPEEEKKEDEEESDDDMGISLFD